MNGVENSSSEKLVLVGEVTAPFGVRGQVKLRPLMDRPETLAKLPAVRLRLPDGREEPRRVTNVRRQQDIAILSFEGILDRNGAEPLRGAQVLIRESELPPLEEDAFYEGQLLGLQVVTESGKDLGRIEQVHFYPANDVYETEVAMIPAVTAIVVRVDLAAGRVVVRDIPGLRKDE